MPGKKGMKRRTKKEMAAARAMAGQDKPAPKAKPKSTRQKKLSAGMSVLLTQRGFMNMVGKATITKTVRKKRKTKAVNKIARVVRKRKVEKKKNRNLGKKEKGNVGFGVSQKKMKKRIKELIKDYKQQQKYWKNRIKKRVAAGKKINAMERSGRGTTLMDWFKRKEPEWFNPNGTKRKGVPVFK